MPTGLTVFAATYLVYIDAVFACGVVALVLYRRPPEAILRWIIAAGITGVMAEVFTQIGSAIYNDPRPFAIQHFRPLVSHAADNGFPSDHALLAAFLVVCVLLVRAWLAVPVAIVFGVLVDWARIGAGIHHPIDVVGSAAFVAFGMVAALLITPFVRERIAPYLPGALVRPEPVSAWRHSSPSSGS